MTDLPALTAAREWAAEHVHQEMRARHDAGPVPWWVERVNNEPARYTRRNP